MGILSDEKRMRSTDSSTKRTSAWSLLSEKWIEMRVLVEVSPINCVSVRGVLAKASILSDQYFHTENGDRKEVLWLIGSSTEFDAKPARRCRSSTNAVDVLSSKAWMSEREGPEVVRQCAGV